MESASPTRQSIQAAAVEPEELSASVGAGWSLFAMMVDQSRRKARRGNSVESARQGKDLAIHLLDQRLFFVEPLLVAQCGVADARQFVGQSAGGLVVVASSLYVQSPAANTIDLAPLGARGGCRAQDTSGSVSKQHAQIAVPALGDVAQVARVARAVLLGRQAKPAGKVARVLEVADIARGRSHHRGGRQQADAGNGQQRGARWTQPSCLGQLALELGDARLKQADLLEQQARSAADQIGNARLGIGQHTGNDSMPMRAPTGMAMPNSRQKPRRALMREVRVPIQSERTRCRPCRACCSTDLMRTGRMSDARAASSKATASAASVLLRRT